MVQMKAAWIKKSLVLFSGIPLFLTGSISSGSELNFIKLPALEGVTGIYSMETGDLDNDGKNDLIVSFLSENQKYKVAIFYNKNRTLEKSFSRELEVAFKSPVKTAIGDFDNDGKNDIAVNERKSTLHLFSGKDNFQNIISNSNVNTFSASIYPAKLIPGGNCDFISSGAVRKWMGGNKWGNGYIYPPENMNANFLCMPADFNDDNKTDIIALSHGEKSIRLYYGPFANINIKSTDASEFNALSFENPAYVITGQLNDDARLDFAISNPEKTGIFYQSRPIGFSENAPSLVIDCGGPLLTADFNGDGKDDLAVLSLTKNKLFIFMQNDKPFSESSDMADIVIPIKKASSFCSGDIDGNGLPDLIIGNASGINIYLNKKQ